MYVELKNINKMYNSYKASDNINLGIRKGKLVALLGPSGSGKSTILRMIAGLETPDTGEIIIDGKVVNNISPSKRGIGFVFQNYALFRYMTVFDNIAFGLKIAKVKKSIIKERVEKLMELVNIKGLGKRYPNQLSGGQRQRVAFARALAPHPELLLLDEPFAAIDAKVRQELRNWLRETIDKVGITSIFVTHDQEEAIEVADEIIVTNKGRIEQIGSPKEIYSNPKTAFVAKFMGNPIELENINRFKGFENLKNGQKAIIRPENVSIIKANEKFRYSASTESGIVKYTLFRGKEVEIGVQINGTLIKGNRKIEEDAVSMGEEVNIYIYRAYAFVENEEVEIVENENTRNQNDVVI
ncbi:sulfate/molybdate ABC transporter ATP-binding protein [Leptotrichia buccalis]